MGARVDLSGMTTTDGRPALALARSALILLACILVLSAWNAVFHLELGSFQGFVEKWSYNVVLVGASLLCIARGLRGEREGRVWLLLGVSMLLWSLGNVYYSVVLWDMQAIPVPSPSDAFWIAFYPGAYLSLLELVRHRRADFGGGLWLDGAIGALAIGSVAIAFVLDRVLSTSGASALSVATNLAYPVGDTVLLMLTVGVRPFPSSTWARIGTGHGRNRTRHCAHGPDLQGQLAPVERTRRAGAQRRSNRTG
jgi:hypothetical protein